MTCHSLYCLHLATLKAVRPVTPGQRHLMLTAKQNIRWHWHSHCTSSDWNHDVSVLQRGTHRMWASLVMWSAIPISICPRLLLRSAYLYTKKGEFDARSLCTAEVRTQMDWGGREKKYLLSDCSMDRSGTALCHQSWSIHKTCSDKVKQHLKHMVINGWPWP